MPTIEFTGDDTAALNYIRKNGYASYSSIKHVRDKTTPSKFNETDATIFGAELHSRLLEKRKIKTLTLFEENQLADMLRVLRQNTIVKQLLLNSVNEHQFRQTVYGVSVLGYIDIDNRPDNVADLKTTRHNSKNAFIEEMDFLQAVLYMKVSGAKNFYYLGICKQPPYTVMPFNVLQFPERLFKAELELRQLLIYIKSKL